MKRAARCRSLALFGGAGSATTSATQGQRQGLTEKMTVSPFGRSLVTSATAAVGASLTSFPSVHRSTVAGRGAESNRSKRRKRRRRLPGEGKLPRLVACAALSGPFQGLEFLWTADPGRRSRTRFALGYFLSGFRPFQFEPRYLGCNDGDLVTWMVQTVTRHTSSMCGLA